MIAKFQFLWILLFINITLTNYPAYSAEVLSVAPIQSGHELRQIIVRFSSDIVPLGDPNAPAPMDVQCTNKNINIEDSDNNENLGDDEQNKFKSNIQFQTRWADSQSWILEFKKPLDGKSRCRLKLKNIKDLKDEKVTGLNQYYISNAGPSILNIAPRYGDIEPEQYFVLELDNLLNNESLSKGAYFEVKSIPEPVGVSLVTGKTREDILKSVIKNTWNWSSLKPFIEKKNINQITELNRFVVIKSNRRFPEGDQIVLHWTSSITSPNKAKNTTEQTFDFNVMKEFVANFNCERANPDSACLPITPMLLNLSRPLPLNSLNGTKLIDSKGHEILPTELDAKKQKQKNQSSRSKDDSIDRLTFAPPFDENSTYKLIIPSQLKDDMGRVLSNANHFPLEVTTDEYSPLIKFAAPFGILETGTGGILPVTVRNVENIIPTSQYTMEGQSFALGSNATPFEIIQWYKKVIEKDRDYSRRNQSLLTSPETKSETESESLLQPHAKSKIDTQINLLNTISPSPLKSKSADQSNNLSPLIPLKNITKIELKKPHNEKEFEVIGIPLGHPGFYVVELQSPRLGKTLTENGPMYVASAALVTNMSIHFKKGRESSLVWVTALDSAKPIDGAEVGIYNEEGVEIKKGTTDDQGRWKLGSLAQACKKDEESTNHYEQTEDGDSGPYPYCPLYIFAKKGNDITFVSDLWERGIEEYRFNVRRDYISAQWGPIVAQTIFDRTLLQNGETIHMKHVLRYYTQNGFKEIQKKIIPKKVLIVHSGSRKTFTLPFNYDSKTGSAINEFKIPKGSPSGSYSVYLSNTLPKKNINSSPNSNANPNVNTSAQNLNSSNSNSDSETESNTESENDTNNFDWEAKTTGSFIVNDYRLPTMSANIKIQGDTLVQPEKIDLDLSANYLSGGPALGLKTKIRATVSPATFTPDISGASEFNFFTDAVTTGIKNLEDKETDHDRIKNLETKTTNLGPDGGAHISLALKDKIKTYSAVDVEMEYADSNGEIKSASAHKNIFPAQLIVGLRSDGWLARPGQSSVLGLVLNNEGKPVSQQSYIVEAFQQKYISHRRRIVGGFYSYDSKLETKTLGQVCTGKTDNLGRFTCSGKSLPAGEIIYQAKVTDPHGQSTYARADVEIFAAGEDAWWSPSDSDRIDLIPEKTQYEPGDTAKFVLRCPFPTSTVLITVEREGVMESYVQEVKRDQPIIEIPIKGNYAPNVFISAMAIRGRVAEPPSTSMIDLAKPALKMGLSEIRVGNKMHALNIAVTADQNKYHTRDKAKIKIKVSTASGEPLPKNSEVAVIAVDEALLRLRSNQSWFLLEGMMGQRGLDVRTSTSQNEVIGRRHFGAKAKAAGGGGGKLTHDVRQLFEAMLLWNPKVPLDTNGEANITVPLNDSMTSFQIEAVGTGSMNYFGEGNTKIQATKELIVYSGLAPLVRWGDHVQNQFTVRNTTETLLKVNLNLTSEQKIELPKLAAIELKPHESKTIPFLTIIPNQSTKLNFEITANETQFGYSDKIKITVNAEPATPARVTQATLFQLDQKHQLNVEKPKDALPDMGGLQIDAKDTLLSGLAGVQSYMNFYPYSCLEQKVSKAIVAADKASIDKIITELPTYFDEDGLLKFFTSSQCGSPQLTNYIIQIMYANNFAFPESTRQRLSTGMQHFINGQIHCKNWWDRFVVDKYRDQEKIQTLDALRVLGSFKSTDLSSIAPQPRLWITSIDLAYARLLKASEQKPDVQEKLKEVNAILRSRVNYAGTLMNLQTDLPWDVAWLLFTSHDREANEYLYNSILELIDLKKQPQQSQPSNQDLLLKQDIGKLARGVLARQRLGVWDSTFANAWGTTVFQLFHREFENEKITGTTVIQPNLLHWDWKAKPHGSSQSLPWPNTSLQTNKPGQTTLSTPLNIEHQGQGKPWMLVQTLAAIPITKEWNNGYHIEKVLTPVVQKTPGTWSVGDVINIDIIVESTTDQNWVVIRDPVPTGASHLGNGLEGSSQILNEKNIKTTASQLERWPSEYEEKSFSDFISYAAYLGKGKYTSSYRIRLNSAGEFHSPPTRVESMYAPEVFGETPNTVWLVK